MSKPINYLANRSLLEQIWLSKLSYCEVYDLDFRIPDLHTTTHPFDLDLITLLDAKRKRLKDARASHLVISHLTDEHIPRAAHPRGGRTSKLGHLDRVTFNPFKLYRVSVDDRAPVFRETVRSHTRAGEFSPDHGAITRTLAQQIMLLVDRYATRGSWRGYSYLSEMKGEALVQLLRSALKFDESKGDNPFSFFTTTVTNEFRKVWKTEDRHQQTRDELLVLGGATPSLKRQTNN